jgi:hypothetical protein
MPEPFERWAALEAERGKTFLHSEPEGYAGTLRRVRSAVRLPLVYTEEEEGSLPCDCTQ